MAPRSDSEWVISHLGEQWRLRLSTPEQGGEPGSRRVELVGVDDPLGDFLYWSFDDGGAKDDEIAGTLLDIYAALTGQNPLRSLERPAKPSHDPRGVLRHFDQRLASQLYDALELGWLRVERVVPPPWPFPDVPDAPITQPDLAPVFEQTTWIAIALVDLEGNPVPGARYRITAPSGRTSDGVLDADGKARLEGLDAGSCKIQFPDFDRGDFA